MEPSSKKLDALLLYNRNRDKVIRENLTKIHSMYFSENRKYTDTIKELEKRINKPKRPNPIKLIIDAIMKIANRLIKTIKL